ncbi:MAG: hypothetical protein ACK55I_41165, partial [bacterium]
ASPSDREYDVPLSPAYSTSSWHSLDFQTCNSPPAIQQFPLGTPIQDLPSATSQEFVPITIRSRPYSLHDRLMDTHGMSEDDEFTDFRSPLFILFGYLDGWDLSILDLITAHP